MPDSQTDHSPQFQNMDIDEAHILVYDGISFYTCYTLRESGAVKYGNILRMFSVVGFFFVLCFSWLSLQVSSKAASTYLQMFH